MDFKNGPGRRRRSWVALGLLAIHLHFFQKFMIVFNKIDHGGGLPLKSAASALFSSPASSLLPCTVAVPNPSLAVPKAFSCRSYIEREFSTRITIFTPNLEVVKISAPAAGDPLDRITLCGIALKKRGSTQNREIFRSVKFQPQPTKPPQVMTKSSSSSKLFRKK